MIWPWLPILILAGELMIRLGLVLRILTRRSPKPEAMAWVVFIALVPVLGLVVYLLVGETPLGRKRRKQHGVVERRMKEIAEQALGDTSQGGWAHAAVPTDTLSVPMLRLGAAVGGLPAMGGNELDLVDDACQMLDGLIADIDKARHHCHMEYYIWGLSPHCVSAVEALMRAAQRGVECRVLLDAVGSAPFWRSPWPGRMAAAGVQVAVALPVSVLRRSLHRIDLRNHRKLTVIDGSIAWCGSQNLLDERVRVRRIPPRYMTWIDATVRVRGPAVVPLQAAFLADWLYESDEQLDPRPYLAVPAAISPASGDGTKGGSLVQVLPSGPGSRADAVHQTFLGMLNAANAEVIITTPYFVPDAATKASLINAALRGIAVTVIVPVALDSRLVAAASRAEYHDLLRAGVTIAHHQGGLLHAKTAVIDGRLAMIGSANFDRRSFWLNFELTVLIYDPVFARVLRALQQKYLAGSKVVTLQAWQRRSWGTRLLHNAAHLMAPLL
ncbi:MAG: cardiolipin synthase [Phycisphaerales bacterium]